jgi:hypothetical protein
MDPQVTVMQLARQLPALQVSPFLQATLHPPQCSMSVRVSTQLPPQLVSGARQSSVQAPATQVWSGRQALPHDPQWASSTCRLRHTPLQAD